MRIVFMGTPQFAVPHLRTLVESQKDIIAVVTRPDRRAGRGKKITIPPIKEVALELGLPVLQPESLSDATFRQEIEQLRPDLISLVAYGGFLPQWLLALPTHECINVHPSLLPKYRGAAPIQRALMNGDHKTGVTTMYMVEAMDAGDIILQEDVEILPEDDAGTLHDRLAQVGSKLLDRTIDLIARGEAPRIPQDENMVTLAPKIERDDELIDWTLKASAVDAHIRGLKPRPGAYTLYQGRRLKVWGARVAQASADISEQPGTILQVHDDAITVATGKGTLHLLEVQPENSRRLRAIDFVNGYRVKVGDQFESPAHADD